MILTCVYVMFFPGIKMGKAWELGFPVCKIKFWDGSQHSKLPLHASHVAPGSKFSINIIDCMHANYLLPAGDNIIADNNNNNNNNNKQRMWNLKCKTIPVIIGATGVVTRSLRKNLEAVPGKHSIDS
jgi:hypothetical protein